SLDNRKPDVSKVWNTAPLVLAVTAGNLRTAFDNVTRNRPGGEPVPVIAGPPELLNHRRKRQARVGRTTRDHDLRSLVQRFDNRPGAEICVRTLNLVAHGRERLTGVHVAQLHAPR